METAGFAAGATAARAVTRAQQAGDAQAEADAHAAFQLGAVLSRGDLGTQRDLAKAKETRTQLLMGGCICVGVHYKFGYMQPLLMTCIMNLFHLYDCKPLHIHLLGKKVERPWAAPAASNDDPADDAEDDPEDTAAPAARVVPMRTHA